MLFGFYSIWIYSKVTDQLSHKGVYATRITTIAVVLHCLGKSKGEAIGYNYFRIIIILKIFPYFLILAKTDFLRRALDTTSHHFWTIETKILIKYNKCNNASKTLDHLYQLIFFNPLLILWCLPVMSFSSSSVLPGYASSGKSWQLLDTVEELFQFFISHCDLWTTLPLHPTLLGTCPPQLSVTSLLPTPMNTFQSVSYLSSL